jgi:hypothetical protein
LFLKFLQVLCYFAAGFAGAGAVGAAGAGAAPGAGAGTGAGAGAGAAAFGGSAGFFSSAFLHPTTARDMVTKKRIEKIIANTFFIYLFPPL